MSSTDKWPAVQWRQEAKYSPHYEGIPDLVPVYEDYFAWASGWRDRFQGLNKLDAYAVIAVRKYVADWTCIIEIRNGDLKEMLRLAQKQLENVLEIDNVNTIKKNHFFLDSWEGEYPTFITSYRRRLVNSTL